ncbi:sigma-70 family RNA polymerase sigma factor, partial [Rhizobium johnstonii]|uniref:sigma-70 family RNA polymerase sigma factor n=1 Tax=Rhizobium johnstonii TaxID=3019933 RepID=UPI003F9776B7
SPVATPEESAIDAERLRYLAAAVEALPERMRMIVRGVYFEDRPVKEIAEELGITHSAVSQQRSEAIRLMRDGLVETYGWEGETGEGSRVGAARRSSY